VGDVGGWTAPLINGLGCGGERELWDSGAKHVDAGVKGWQLSVEELWVGTNRFLLQVEVSFLNAGIFACRE
jgi:hypothetical protein